MVHHFFLPHKKGGKHKKAHLLSIQALFFYVAIFVFMQLGFAWLRTTQPGVLGTTSTITRQEIINLTNIDRQKNGLSILTENSKLDQAAEAKAKNMFNENYWAHTSPSGKSPWEWIQQSEYNYLFAGENLARSYSSAKSVEEAWMASKIGHRENILNSRYQEIGIAVEDGLINGEKTTLVVQLFGTPIGATSAKSQIGEGGVKTVADNKVMTNIPSAQVPARLQEVKSADTVALTPSVFSQFITINPYAITRTFSLSLIVLLTLLGLVDLFVVWKRKVLVNLHFRHLPHAGVISAAVIILFIMQAGVII